MLIFEYFKSVLPMISDDMLIFFEEDFMLYPEMIKEIEKEKALRSKKVIKITVK